MLRSERVWFPIFLQICSHYLEWLEKFPERNPTYFAGWNNPTRYEAIKVLREILKNDSYRHVKRLLTDPEIRKRILILKTRARMRVWLRKEFGVEFTIALDDFTSKYHDFDFDRLRSERATTQKTLLDYFPLLDGMTRGFAKATVDLVLSPNQNTTRGEL